MHDWNVDPLEKVRRLIDLITISVFLDAGAGSVWKYNSSRYNQTFQKSEGIAIAVLEMFLDGNFSSDPALPRVNSMN